MTRVHPAWRPVYVLFVLAGIAVGARVAAKTDVLPLVPKPAVRAIGAGAGALGGVLAYRVVWVLGALAREGARVRAERRAARAAGELARRGGA